MKSIWASWLALAAFGCATPNGAAPTLLVSDAIPSAPPVALDDQERSYADRSGERRRRRATTAGPRDRRSEFSILLGGRGLDEDDDWDPNEGQLAFGIETVVGIWRGLGVELGLSTGYSFEEDEPTNNDDSTFFSVEGAFGLRYAHPIGRFVPYVGGGLAGIIVYQEIDGRDFDDESLAGYVHGGAQFHVTDFFAVGLDIRRLFGSDIDRGISPAGTPLATPQDSDVDYLQAALRLTFVF